MPTCIGSKQKWFPNHSVPYKVPPIYTFVQWFHILDLQAPSPFRKDYPKKHGRAFYETKQPKNALNRPGLRQRLPSWKNSWKKANAFAYVAMPPRWRWRCWSKLENVSFEFLCGVNIVKRVWEFHGFWVSQRFSWSQKRSETRHPSLGGTHRSKKINQRNFRHTQQCSCAGGENK